MAFLNCDDNDRKINDALFVLSNNADVLERAVNNQVEEIDTYINDGILSATSVVDDAIKEVDGKIKGVFPDWTDRLNNIDGALETYDKTLDDFKNAILTCKQSQLAPFINKLGIEVPEGIIDPFAFSSSEIRKKIRDLTFFPTRYLQSIKSELIEDAVSTVHALSNDISEFINGTILEEFDDRFGKKIAKVAREVELLLNCFGAIKCGSNITKFKDRYGETMAKLPIYPPFELPSDGALNPFPPYTFNSGSVIDSVTTLTTTQKTNFKNAAASAKNAMNYTRSIIGKI